MTKHKLKTTICAISVATLSISLATASFAQSRQNQQGANALGDLIGMIANASAKSDAKKKWAKVSPEIQQCVNTMFSSKNVNVDQIIAAGMSPTAKDIAPVIELCQTVMTAQLKTDFSCNVPNSKGVQVPTTCVQSYAKAVNGKWAPVSRDDFLRAVGNDEKVIVGDFETTVAQNARLAEEKRLAQGTEVRRFAPEAAVSQGGSPLLSVNANWVRQRGGGPPQYYDENSLNRGSTWTNYRAVVVYRQNEEVDGESITSDFRITETAVECSETRDRYVMFVQRHYFVGKFDPQNPKTTASSARMVAQDTKASAFSNAAWQDEIATMCRSRAAQTGFALNENQRKVVERARAFNAPRLAKEREETRRRPRGYMVACSGTKNSELNLYFVNCDNPVSVRDGFRWAYNRLLVERSDGRHFASGCIENLRKYSNFPPSVASNRQVINGSLAACNVGLQYVQGPSAADATVRKR